MAESPKREQGAALLTVLLLVAVMSVIAAAAIDRLSLATRLTGNAAAADQARAYALAAETVARMRISDLLAASPGKTTLRGGWHGRPQPVPIPEGIATVTVTDSGNCFNLNSVVAGKDEDDLKVRPTGVIQFQALMQSLGIDDGRARIIAASLVDWIDSDSVRQPGGAEDDTYGQLEKPYRTANRFMADPSELRAVNGVSPAIYATLRPWVCALPTSELSPINVNTLLPQQAPLFAMLIPGKLTVDRARQLLAQRPADGYGSLPAFWKLPAVVGLSASPEAVSQTKLTSRWFKLEINVEIAGVEVGQIALLDAQETPARLVYRHWSDPGETA